MFMFRKIIFSLSFIFLSIQVLAQAPDSTYKIAPFKITLSDGKQFKSTDLKPGSAILIYFSPDCDHCQEFTKEIVQNYSKIRNKQIVMITAQPLSMVKRFIQDYSLSKYPNIKIGSEGKTYKVQYYYQIQSFPFVAMYNRNGRLSTVYQGRQPFSQFLKGIQRL